MTLQSLSAVAASARIARMAAPQPVPAAAAEARSDASVGFDPRLGKSEAMAAAVFAARSQFDSRVTGPTETVTRFDRMALVIEGFEHLREVLDGLAQQASEDFGPAAAAATDSAAVPALYGSLDLRM